MQAILDSIRGRELVEAVEALCDDRGVGAGWVRGFGSLESVELTVEGRLVSFGPATLVTFDASVAMVGDRATVRPFAVVSADVGGVPVTVGGELRRASCADVELAIVAFPGVRATRRAGADGVARLEVGASAARAEPPGPELVERPAPRAVAPEREASDGPRASRPAETPAAQPAAAARPSTPAAPVPAAPRATPAGPKKDWGAVAAASAKAAAGDWDEADDGEVDVDELERGDVLMHPQLAECRVVSVISDDAVKVQLPNGSVRKLVMRGFRLFRERDNVYRIERKP